MINYDYEQLVEHNGEDYAERIMAITVKCGKFCELIEQGRLSQQIVLEVVGNTSYILEKIKRDFEKAVEEVDDLDAFLDEINLKYDDEQHNVRSSVSDETIDEISGEELSFDVEGLAGAEIIDLYLMNNKLDKVDKPVLIRLFKAYITNYNEKLTELESLARKIL